MSGREGEDRLRAHLKLKTELFARRRNNENNLKGGRYRRYEPPLLHKQ